MTHVNKMEDEAIRSLKNI